jgi:glutamate synthase domain-containing protein 3
MSGGIAYVLDGIGMLASRCNRGLVELEALAAEDEEFLQGIIGRHVEFTSSELGARVLHNWSAARQQFVKVMPRDYKRVMLERLTAGAHEDVAPGAIARAAGG